MLVGQCSTLMSKKYRYVKVVNSKKVLSKSTFWTKIKLLTQDVPSDACYKTLTLLGEASLHASCNWKLLSNQLVQIMGKMIENSFGPSLVKWLKNSIEVAKQEAFWIISDCINIPNASSHLASRLRKYTFLFLTCHLLRQLALDTSSHFLACCLYRLHPEGPMTNL